MVLGRFAGSGSASGRADTICVGRTWDTTVIDGMAIVVAGTNKNRIATGVHNGVAAPNTGTTVSYRGTVLICRDGARFPLDFARGCRYCYNAATDRWGYAVPVRRSTLHQR